MNKFQQRMYNTKQVLPKPYIVFEAADGLLVVAHVWGLVDDESEKMLKNFVDQLKQMAEPDTTRSTVFYENLSPQANRLRASCQWLNDFIYGQKNRSELTVAVELLALVQEKKIISWAHVGSLNVWARTRQGLVPLTTGLEWSSQHPQNPPLFSQALGVDRQCLINSGSFAVADTSHLILSTHNNLESAVVTSAPTLQGLSQYFVGQNPDRPFWVGLCEVADI